MRKRMPINGERRSAGRWSIAVRRTYQSPDVQFHTLSRVEESAKKYVLTATSWKYEEGIVLRRRRYSRRTRSSAMDEYHKHSSKGDVDVFC